MKGEYNMKRRRSPTRGILTASLVFLAVGVFLVVNYFSNYSIGNSYTEVQNTDSSASQSTEESSEDLSRQDKEEIPKTNSVNDKQPVTEDESSHVIEDFDLTLQMPELPTGCEITALTMVLNYYGYDVDKITMASEYLPISSSYFYYGSDGNLYGPDLNNYFVGDPFTAGGYICGTGAIVTAADDYLAYAGSSLRASDITGSTPEELYQLVDEDIPVVVWVTVYMVTRSDVSGWYTEYGEYVDWSTSDHGAVLIGYSDDTVTIADPISGIVEYDREQFESVFESRGNKCVILT